MNKRIYDIRLCRITEIAKLRHFINNHWKENHILCYSNELFYFQHKNEEDHDLLNFVVAENIETNEFDGVFGFILSNIYDHSKEVLSVKWGAIWKVREDIQNSEIRSLGFALFKFVLDLHPTVPYCVIGMSDKNIAICEALHFTCGKLIHYYMANQNIRDFKIAKNPYLRNIECKKELEDIREADLDSIEFIYNSINPYKNIEYFKGRYSSHPIYKYKYYGIYNSAGILKLILVVRKIELLKTSVLRIVDMIGDFKGCHPMYNSVQELLQQENAEYIDCYNAGIDEKTFIDLGFTIVKGDTIIPDYFEPFERRNITLNFAHSSDKTLIIFKGDGDQDRPSKWNN